MLMKADPEKRESLQAEAEVDPMDGEQTWPTEAELEEAEGTTLFTPGLLSLIKTIENILLIEIKHKY